MGVRFRKIFSFGRLFHVRLGKSGASFSLGRPGASVSLGRQGINANAGIPGTGWSVRERVDVREETLRRIGAGLRHQEATPKDRSIFFWVILGLVFFFLVRAIVR